MAFLGGWYYIFSVTHNTGINSFWYHLSQVTVPRFRENPLIIPFSMLCPGISQNTKLHHLTLYKGQVWGEKSYLELCNHNFLNILFEPRAVYRGDIMEQNGALYVPPVPGDRFIKDKTMIPYDSEILQSFAELTNITNMTFHKTMKTIYEDSLEDFTYQILVGSSMCYVSHDQQCAPPQKYFPWYIWTKEGFKIRINYSVLKTTFFQYFNILSPTPSFHHKDPE